jgi:hypothetical protein
MNEGARAEIIQFPRRLRLPVDVAAREGRAVRALEQADSRLGDDHADLRRANNALIGGLNEIAESLQVLEMELMTTLSQMEGSSAAGA